MSMNISLSIRAIRRGCVVLGALAGGILLGACGQGESGTSSLAISRPASFAAAFRMSTHW